MAPKGIGSDPGAGSCGLTTWGSNSQITHVVSTSGPLGPYGRHEVALGTWSHNPLVRAIGGDLIMYHIGSGSNVSQPGDGYCGLNATSPCGEQSFDKCGANATCPAVPGFACMAGYCSGDGQRDGDCGGDLAEPALNCDTLASCATAASAACDATPGCASFALSSAWGLGKAKLFSAGKSGAVPNAQWSTWYRSTSASESHPVGAGYPDMYQRARLEGRWPVPPPQVAPDGSCDLEVHYSATGTPAGPWVPAKGVTISPCGGNNPGPWVHPNGTIYLVVTDGG